MTSLISFPTPVPVPVLSPIRIVASSDSSPLFSVQDALSTFSGYDTTNLPSENTVQGPGTLFRSGCVVDGIPNCTAACQDVNQVFADPHTFQNCMVVASLTVLGPNVTLDASSTALAEDFSIHIDESDFQSLASGVNQTIQDCLHQYLDKYPEDNWCFWPWYQVVDGDEPAYSLNFQSCCDNLMVPLNADVGGIGVQNPTVFYEDKLTYARFTSLTGFKAASLSQLF